MNDRSSTIIVSIDAFNLIYDSNAHEIVSVLDLERIEVSDN